MKIVVGASHLWIKNIPASAYLYLRVLRRQLPQPPHPPLQQGAQLLISLVEGLQLGGHLVAARLSLQALQAAVQAGLNLQHLAPELLDPKVVDLYVGYVRC